MPLEKKDHWRGFTGLLDRRQTKYNPAAAVTWYLQSVGALQSADTGVISETGVTIKCRQYLLCMPHKLCNCILYKCYGC